MALGTGLCAGKIVAGVLGIGAASVLGFNWITTGCPTGVCPSETKVTETSMSSAVVPVALTTAGSEKAADSCCQLMDAAADVKSVKTVAAEEASSCCAEKASEAAVTTVALPTEAASCCSEKAEGAVTNVALATKPEAKEAGSCCFDAGATTPCDGEKACCQENFGLADTSAVKP